MTDLACLLDRGKTYKRNQKTETLSKYEAGKSNKSKLPSTEKEFHNTGANLNPGYAKLIF